MCSNKNNINYNNFENICRTCSLNCDVKIIQDAAISEIFYRLTDIPFVTHDDLPKQICLKCFDKIIEIQEFSKKCIRAHTSLMKCLNNYKNMEIMEEQQIKNEITIEEHQIEFVNTEEYNTTNNEVVNELCKRTHSVLMECLNNYKNIEIKEEPETNDPMEIIDEITIEEHQIEFVKVEEEDSSNNELDQNFNNPFKCDECATSFAQAEGLKIHMRVHSGERKECSNSFVKENRIHSGEPSYIQTSINEVVDELDQNINNPRHNHPHKCDQCAKSFKYPCDLNNHKRIHSGEYIYKCDQCTKKFTQARYLKIHERAHSGERPYACDQCAKTFAQADHLKSHKHVHSGERSYNCDQCIKTFLRAADLKRHKRVHSGERPYKCDQCSKKFTQAGHLMVHKFVHSGERPYKCDQCAKTFTQVGHLKIHKRIHSR